MSDEPDQRTLKETVDTGAYGAGVWKDHPLFDDIRPYWEDYEEDVIKKKQLTHRVALLIMRKYNIIKPPKNVLGWMPVLHRYDPEHGIYRPDGREFVRTQAARLMAAEFKDTDRTEVVKQLQDYATMDTAFFQTKQERLVVGNGILDVTTGELDPYDPQEPHLTRIDVNYPDNPDEAGCEKYDEFLHSLVDDSNVQTLYRLIAHTLYKGYPSSRAAMLAGDGKNGKSTFLATVRKFLHPGENIDVMEESHRNVSAESLQDIASPTNRWSEASLHGSLANIDPDMGSQDIKQAQTFKKATGGKDALTAEHKFEPTFEFVNHATMMFAVNEVPAAEEDSDAYWRRWIFINFPYVFKEGDGNYVNEDDLIAEVASEEQLQGLLVKCVEEIKRWRQTDTWYPNIPSSDEVRKEMKKASDSVYAFATDCVFAVDDPDDTDYIVKDDLRDLYRDYCNAEGIPHVTESTFDQRILNIKDIRIETGRTSREDGPGRTPVYKGIHLSPRGHQLNAEESLEQSDLDLDYDEIPQNSYEAVNKFIKNQTEPNEDGYVPKAELREEFMQWAEDKDIDVTTQEFGQVIYRVDGYDLDTQRKSFDGERKRVYTGISWDRTEDEPEPDPEESITEVAAKATSIVRTANGDGKDYSEVLMKLAQEGYDTQTIANGIEKAIVRGDIAEHGTTLVS